MSLHWYQPKILLLSVAVLVFVIYILQLSRGSINEPLRTFFMAGSEATITILTADDMIRICKDSPDLWCDDLLPYLNEQDATLFKHNHCRTHNEYAPFKVSYLKTHKTGSSTLSSVMYRYAEFNDLIHLLPKPVKAPYRKNKKNPWDKKYSKLHMYEFFGYHAARYNISQWEAKFGPNTVFITIIRNPVGNFESSYSYFGKEAIYNKTAIEYLDYLNKSEEFYKKESFKPWYNGINPQIKDLGFPRNLTLESEVAQIYISKLEEHMNLVLINEAFDESLVLLANRLCLPLRNVTYMSQKQRRNDTKVPLDAAHQEIIKRHYTADQLLYDTFLKNHNQAVNEFGMDIMKLAVEQLRELNTYILTKCDDSIVNTQESKKKKGPRIREMLTVKHVESSSNLDCFYLSLLEEDFKLRIWKREKLRWEQYQL